MRGIDDNVEHAHYSFVDTELVALQPPGRESESDIALASGFALHMIAEIPAQVGPASPDADDPVFVLAELSSSDARFTVGISKSQHLGIWLRDLNGRCRDVQIPPNKFVGGNRFYSFEMFPPAECPGELWVAVDGNVIKKRKFFGFALPDERKSKLCIGFDHARQRPAQFTPTKVIVGGQAANEAALQMLFDAILSERRQSPG